MGQHRIVVADVNAEADALISRKFGLPAGKRDASAMCHFLRSAGVRAIPSADGVTITIPVRNTETTQELHDALVYFIVAAAYRFEADIRVLTAIGTYQGDVNSQN